MGGRPERVRELQSGRDRAQGYGDLGDIPVALDLASLIEVVGQEVRRLQQAGQTVGQIVAERKPKVVSAYPGWEHPGLSDWEIGYFAAQSA